MRTLLNLILISTASFLFGCATSPLQVASLQKIDLHKNKSGTAVVILKTGEVISGSGPVSGDDKTGFSATTNMASNEWGFNQVDQTTFVNHFIAEIRRSQTFTSIDSQNGANADYAININFRKTIQEANRGVYYFDVAFTITHNGKTELEKTYIFKATEQSEEYWKSHGWSDSKSRAANRLMEKITADFQQWLNE